MVGIRIRGALLMERTRHGWHVIVPLSEKLTEAEMIALQLCMGDDRKRGALNLMRGIAIRKGGDSVTAYWRKRSNILFGGKVA